MTETAPAPSLDFNGTWKSQRGSLMTLRVSGNIVTGHYQSAIGAAQLAEKYPLQGFVTGDLITYSVNFGALATVAAWVGQHVAEKTEEPVLKAVFIAAVNVAEEDEANFVWGAVRTGEDVFTRIT